MNPEIENYINDIRTVSEEFYQIVLEARKLFLSSLPESSESIKYGGIVYSNDKDLIGGIFTYKKHISIEFSQGAQLNDNDSVLEGKGKYRRHIKLQTIQDISNKKVEIYIQQAIELDSL
ncbi:MAG: DUF1801 domain-containing protein [Gammaproteobacteria bacterium]|nr:DUF1801 domain-containing protein [Gammaproteobacteria bacterium]